MPLRAVSKFFAVALAVLVVPWAAPKVFGSDLPLSEDIKEKALKVFEDRRAAVVKVRARDKLGIRFGSGFFADPTGTVYTHAAVVMNADEVTVLDRGREMIAKVLIADERSGIAILKVDDCTPSIPIGDSQKVAIGTPLMMIGYPEDLEAIASLGKVSALDKKHHGEYFSTTHIRANLPVQRGQGGAPVLNIQGEAVGILIGLIDAGAGCHILPMRAAEKVRRDLARFGALRPGWVGVEVEDSAAPAAGSTARVGALDSETPAAQSGLKPGDVLLKIGETPILSSEDVIDASYFLTAGDSTEIEVVRGTQKILIGVKPTLHPLAREHEIQTTALPDVRIRLE